MYLRVELNSLAQPWNVHQLLKKITTYSAKMSSDFRSDWRFVRYFNLLMRKTCSFVFTGLTEQPRFAEPIPNVTVALGRDASLPCVVNNLGTYKVSITPPCTYRVLITPNSLLAPKNVTALSVTTGLFNFPLFTNEISLFTKTFSF